VFSYGNGSGVALHDDPRGEIEASFPETAIEVGWFEDGTDECPEGVNSPHGKPIKKNGDCFHQEDHPQETIDVTPKGTLKIQGSVRSFYGKGFSHNMIRRNGRVYVDFIISLCY